MFSKKSGSLTSKLFKITYSDDKKDIGQNSFIMNTSGLGEKRIEIGFTDLALEALTNLSIIPPPPIKIIIDSHEIITIDDRFTIYGQIFLDMDMNDYLLLKLSID